MTRALGAPNACMAVVSPLAWSPVTFQWPNRVGDTQGWPITRRPARGGRHSWPLCGAALSSSSSSCSPARALGVAAGLRRAEEHTARASILISPLDGNPYYPAVGAMS